MTPALHIWLLGDFRLVCGEEAIASVNTARLQALMAYLVLHAGTPQSRQHLAFRFWPDSTEPQARTNLRQLLHHLRQALQDADRFILTDGQTVAWNGDAACSLDVWAFEEAAGRAEEEKMPSKERDALETAVQIYVGDLLPSCYDEWIEPERERLRQRYLVVLDRLVVQLEGHREYAQAIRYARLLLQTEPLREPTYRTLMRLHALRADRAGALRVYHECASVLERELDVQPAPETRALHEQLLEGSTPSPDPPVVLAGETALVARQAEWTQLQQNWNQAREGEARLTVIGGEAGIGKTRLAEELLAWAHRQGIPVARARCYAAEGRLPFGPVADWLRAPAVAPSLQSLDPVWRVELGRILPELAPGKPGATPPQTLIEEWQRRRFFEALARAALGDRSPRLLLLDDIQWCDQDTLEWLRYLLRFDLQAPLLVLTTARVEEVGSAHPVDRLLLDLRREGRLTEIALAPLSAEDTATLAERVTGTALTPNVAALLYREMEGNPLFVVEGIRAGMIGENHDSSLSEDGEGPTSSSLATSIQAILAARLRQLSPEARRLATLAATIGRAFSFEVLAVASGRAEEELVRDLDEMWHWRIIREDGAGGYDFSHDKLRAVAYKEMSTVQRRALHRRVAEALLTVTAEEVDPVSGAVAYHFDRAALPMRALPYYERAAESARQVHATGEAIRYLRRALTLLDGLPPGPARDRRECALLTRLGPVLEATRGWADPEVGRVHERARALWDEEAGTSLLVPILWGLRTFHITRAEFDATHERGEELLRLARDRDDPLLQAAAYLTLGMTFFHRGDLPGARRHLERALSAHQNEPGAQAPEDFSFGPDLRVFALGYLSHTLCLLGRPDLALARSRESRVRAERLGHPFTQALALDYAALLHHFRREPDEARAAAGVAIALCEKHGFAYYCAWGHIVEGATRSEDGDGERGRQCLQGGIEALTATGARLRMPYYLGLQASACRAGGETGQGLAYLEDALRLGHATDEHWGDAELHRLRGEFLRDTAPADADACFRAAWAQARRSHSRLFALRAATSRCRLALQVDAAAEAYSQLAEAIAWFVDGDDTADLREARAVLDEVQ